MMVQAKLLIFLCTVTTAYTQVCRDYCKIATVKKLKSADCYRQELKKVPRCHTSGVEILDLSFNRIREIDRDDLDSYPYIKLLYLSDNSLTFIDDVALADKHYLHTLDLSYNAFYKIPSAIFKLPALWKLYLNNIGNPAMVGDIEAALPVTSPLAHLDLSINKLVRLPNLGNLPTLQTYNVSGNMNVSVNISVFAGLCNLKEFYNDGFSAVFEDPCDCQYLNTWLKLREVSFKEIQCADNLVCNGSVPEEYVRIYNGCKSVYEQLQFKLFRQQILTNTGIAAAVILILFIIVLLLYLRSKKNKRRKTNSPQPKHKKYSDRSDIDFT